MKPYQRRKEAAFLGTVLPIIMSRTTMNYSAAVAVSAAVTDVVVVVVVGDDAMMMVMMMLLGYT